MNLCRCKIEHPRLSPGQSSFDAIIFSQLENKCINEYWIMTGGDSI